VTYENAVESYLVAGIKAKGGECPKFEVPGRKGAPDRIVLMPTALIVFVETKTIGGRLESWQERFHAMLRRLGFRVEVLWTVLQVDEFLATI
jgi:VRR-NUC domain